MEWEHMAFVALGSNLGDSRRTILAAMDRLQQLSEAWLLRSSLWETMPLDCPPGSPRFINAVVGFRPRLTETPELLLGKLQSLEEEFGRAMKKVLNEPRLLDLDLIAFGRVVRESARLTLPHPRARQRRFVLQPLSEIVPDFVFPGESRRVYDLLSMMPPDGTMRIA
jgi:2-amino-4-hydroxy-6-hydroxymethyldihydropteridine diphosphokinase